MFQKVFALTICLTLTSCGFSTLVTPTIPKQYLVKCDVTLPDAKSGSKQDIQDNRKEHQGLYHTCAHRHNGLVDELEAQGIKGK